MLIKPENTQTFLMIFWRETSDVTELGRLCSKKRCFNDLSVSPMYVAGNFSMTLTPSFQDDTNAI